VALVVDVSAVLALVFVDEPGDYAERVVSHVATTEAFVPSLFWFELRNAVVMGERRGRLTAEQSSRFLAAIHQLPLRVDHEPDENLVLALARQHRLTVYDASYLALASRLGLPLASLDSHLRAAAQSSDVKVF